MEAAFKIPSDLPLLSQFNDLVSAVGNRSRAYHIWYLIWQDLFFRAQEGAPRGRLPRAMLPGLLRTLSEVEPDADRCRELFHKVIVEQSRVLEKDGEDYVCPRFIIFNSQVGKGSRESVGGNRKAFIARQKKVQGQAFEQSLLIPANRFVDGDGKALDADKVKRVTRLIISCDNALYKPERQPMSYTEGLIQSALSVLAKYTDEEINLIINKISFQRDHPALNGMVTENLLPVLEDTARKLA